MGFILTVEGTTLGVDTIKTVDFAVTTPNDSNAKTTDVAVTATITGKILTMLDDGTEGTVDAGFTPICKNSIPASLR